MNQWYALHTDPKVELMVVEALGQHGIETFLPETRAEKIGQKQRRIPLFPGYLFINVDLNEEDPAHWRWVAGVRYIVSYGDWPVPVPGEVIRLIQKKIEALESDTAASTCPFQRGDKVRIKEGPFKAMLGIFDGPLHPKSNVRVLLCGLSNAARLRIKPSKLKKVSGSADAPTRRRRRRTRGHGRTIHYD
jgi:transcriptional antiterminator RfaH